jgi:LPS O-antigen subunit length determinant protein (WzzB/FepE family)
MDPTPSFEPADPNLVPVPPEPPSEGSGTTAAAAPVNPPQPGWQQAIPESSGAGHVDKIREILFGKQIRDYEARFTRLEESLAKESISLRETVQRRLDSLEIYVKKEFEAIEQRLRGEREERSEADRQTTRDLDEIAASLRRRIGDVEDRGASAQRDLREQILVQSQQLRDEIRTKFEEAAALLDRQYNLLHTAKADRAAIANLLSEMALRLNDEFRLPESGGH